MPGGVQRASRMVQRGRATAARRTPTMTRVASRTRGGPRWRAAAPLRGVRAGLGGRGAGGIGCSSGSGALCPALWASRVRRRSATIALGIRSVRCLAGRCRRPPAPPRRAAPRWPGGRDPAGRDEPGVHSVGLGGPAMVSALRPGPGSRGRAARRAHATPADGGWPGAGPRRRHYGPGTGHPPGGRPGWPGWRAVGRRTVSAADWAGIRPRGVAMVMASVRCRSAACEVAGH